MALTESEELELLELENANAMASKQNTPSSPSFLERLKNIPTQAWNALKVPEQLSEKGLGLIAGMTPEFVPQSAVKRFAGAVASPIIGPIGPLAGEIAARMGQDKEGPSGNVVMDIARGTPKVLAETAKKTAPSFVSRGAILAASAGPLIKGLGMPVKYIGKKAASAIEGYQNVPKGTFAEAYRDPSIYLDKGAAVAGKAYREAKEAAGAGSEGLFGDITNLKDVSNIKLESVVNRALELAKDGKLNPASAQSARKAVDEMFRSKAYSKEAVLELRQFFDSIVKGDSGLAKADIAYQRAIKADALRQLFPLNKGGGGSPFRIFASNGLAKIPIVGKPLAFVTGSPALAGATSAGAGMIGRTAIDPMQRIGTSALLKALSRKKEVKE
ncbi:MAG TPA: hypothetical protein PLN86_16945 [Candidatus Hydrogenedentes bacterium]|nr:hypothetical protein [Candidatus Hydrogenedentota bacterium]